MEAQIVSDVPSKISSKLDAVCAQGKLSEAEGKENKPSLLEAPRRKPTIHRLAYVGANEKLAKKIAGQAAKESKQLTETGESGITFSKANALALQADLLQAFTAADFQKKLHELVRLHNAAATEKSAEYHLAFRKLVRSEQLPIVARYGFKATEEGLIEVLQRLKEFQEDADISVNAAAIQEALFSASTPATSVEAEEAKFGYKPHNKKAVLELLRLLHENYSQPEFQAGVNNLKYFQKDRRYAAGGYYHLPGRAELAERIQETLLPRHGFEASKEGVNEMISVCANYLGDAEVASLFDAINGKLGMTPVACQRFRKVAAIGLAEMKQSPPETQCCSAAHEPVEVGRWVEVMQVEEGRWLEVDRAR